MNKGKKWAFRIFITIIILILIIAGVFQKDIKEVLAILKYANIFKPDVITENFRSLFNQYPHKEVRRSGDIYKLDYSTQPLIENISLNGKSIKISNWIERTDTTSFIVINDGKIVFEKYYQGNNENTKLVSMSVSKSIISFLIGTALDDGSISNLQDPVDQYVPQLKGSGYEGVSIKDVIQMSSGIRFTEDYHDLKSDIVCTIAAFTTGSLNNFTSSLPREVSPGRYNKYVSANTQVLGMVLANGCGKSVTEITEEKLWSRLGFESDGIWLTDPQGIELTLGGFYATPRDYARFGLLYLNDGQNHKGEQLVSKEWIKTSITPDAPHLLPGKDNPYSEEPIGYAYHWWIPVIHQGDFVAIGIYGQFIYIHPNTKTVIVKTSAYKDYENTGLEMEYETIDIFQIIANSFE